MYIFGYISRVVIESAIYTHIYLHSLVTFTLYKWKKKISLQRWLLIIYIIPSHHQTKKTWQFGFSRFFLSSNVILCCVSLWWRLMRNNEKNFLASLLESLFPSLISPAIFIIQVLYRDSIYLHQTKHHRVWIV